MTVHETTEIDPGLLSLMLSEESFWPAEPNSLAETGLSESYVEGLILKHLTVIGTSSGRAIARAICLPLSILAELYESLRTRQLVVHAGTAPLNDYYYTLTEEGRNRARGYLKECAYVGPAPV